LAALREAECLEIKDFGHKCLKELRQLLEDHGLRFGLDLGDWRPATPDNPASLRTPRGTRLEKT
jgi:DNA-directed RNA polymerase alpha subunit